MSPTTSPSERPPADPAPAAARPCSMASALAAVGEKWSLLAIREISLGNRRFDQIARNTGAPRDRLTARLRALDAAGIIERRPYRDRPPRFEYRLTAAGKDLIPVLTTLRSWGDRWALNGPAPITFHHGPDQHQIDPVLTCRTCGGELKAREMTGHVHAAGWSLAGPMSDQPEEGS